LLRALSLATSSKKTAMATSCTSARTWFDVHS
jgi:hypothetical protein